MTNTRGNLGGANYKCTMPLLKLRGVSSRVTLHLEHPIHLEENVKHRMALVAFFTDNNIYNVRDEANIFFWDSDIHAIPNPLTFTRGYWTVESMEATAKDYIKSLNLNVDPTKFRLSKNGDFLSVYSPLKFYMDQACCKLFGFDPPTKEKQKRADSSSYHIENQTVTGTRPPKLRAVDTIEIHCNIVHNSLVNHDTHDHKHAETELLYTFFPQVPHGYKISEQPKERLYVDLKPGLRTIHCITINILDQDNNPILNSNVENLVYLDLVSL